MFISKQELYEKLQYVTPRTFAYLNEIDYYNLLISEYVCFMSHSQKFLQYIIYL